ncbi:MAG: hypothetical protein J7L40_00070 [Candidatus Marinimicrobia bacterium]|nr:hypothetical protein [Candidatus Neomarinimicrobiota bacterium]
MDVKRCNCPICKKSAKRKEIDHRGGLIISIYECDMCGKFSVDKETLKFKEDFIKENQKLISRYIREYTDNKEDAICEIVAKEEKIKERNQITFEQMVERQQEKEGA